jgi:hypothetical protein
MTNFSVTYPQGKSASANLLLITNTAVNKTINLGSSAGGTSTNSFKIRITGGTNTATITFVDNSWIDELDLNQSGTAGIPIALSGTTYGINLNSIFYHTSQVLTSFIPVFTTATTFNNNKSWGGVGVNSGVTLTLGDSSGTTFTATSKLILTRGTINLSNIAWTFGGLNSNNANTRSITFGTNNIVLAHTTAATVVLSMAIATGFTWDNTSTGGFTSAMSATRTFTFGTTGGSTTNAPNLSLTSGASTSTFTDGSWFDALNFTGSTCTVAVTASLLGINVDTLTLATGGTYTSLIPVFTRSQTWTPQYSKQLGGIGVGVAGVTLTLLI